MGIKDIACVLCDFKTGFKHLLNKHVKTMHTNFAGHPCDQCEYVTTGKQNLKQHV